MELSNECTSIVAIDYPNLFMVAVVALTLQTCGMAPKLHSGQLFKIILTSQFHGRGTL